MDSQHGLVVSNTSGWPCRSDAAPVCQSAYHSAAVRREPSGGDNDTSSAGLGQAEEAITGEWMIKMGDKTTAPKVLSTAVRLTPVLRLLNLKLPKTSKPLLLKASIDVHISMKRDDNKTFKLVFKVESLKVAKREGSNKRFL